MIVDRWLRRLKQQLVDPFVLHCILQPERKKRKDSKSDEYIVRLHLAATCIIRNHAFHFLFYFFLFPFSIMYSTGDYFDMLCKSEKKMRNNEEKQKNRKKYLEEPIQNQFKWAKQQERETSYIPHPMYT